MTRTIRLARYLKKKKKSSKCSNPRLSVRFLDKLVHCVIHNLVNLCVICFCESDIIYFLGIVSGMMMQIKFLKTFASEGSILVFAEPKEIGFRLFQPLKKGGKDCSCKDFCYI